jgi:hypothetical protein
MESVLISFISLTLIIISTVTMTMSTLNSTAKLSQSWKAMQEKTSILQKTQIIGIPPDNYSGGIIELTIKNTGQVNISDFTYWDVIVEDQSGGAVYLSYSTTYPPAINEWAIQGIYVSDNDPEVFNINILNPGEQLLIGLNPDPATFSGQPIKITIATGDGVTTQCFITRSSS